MSDYFALLDEPRRPWLNVDLLKAKFLACSVPVHPDRCHAASPDEQRTAQQRFAEFNAAYCALADPKERLLHLLTLEQGAPPRNVQRLPPGTMDLFAEIGQACREVDQFLAASVPENSPMLKLQRFQKGLAWAETLRALEHKVQAQRETLLHELKTLNPVWEGAPPLGDPSRPAVLALDRLEVTYRRLSYLSRWAEQLRERSVTLSLPTGSL